MANWSSKPVEATADEVNQVSRLKIFISYSRRDEGSARKLYGQLKHAGVAPWLDKENLLPGQRWEDEIKNEIRGSHFVLLLLSSVAIGKKGFYQKEIKLALDTYSEIPSGQIFLLPVRLDNCVVPTELGSIHCVDLFPDWDDGFARILKAVELQQTKRTAQTTALPTARLVYPERGVGSNESVRKELMRRYCIGRVEALDSLIAHLANVLQMTTSDAEQFLLEVRRGEN